MANFIVPTEVPNLKAIQLQPTPSLMQVLPVMSVGQILPITIRHNTSGQGLIFFQGQLVPAKLPADLAGGQRLMVQISKADDQIVLKLLDGLKAQTAAPLSPAAQSTQNISSQLQDIAKNAGAPLLSALEPFTLPENLQVLAGQNVNISKVLSTLNDSTSLEDATQTLKTLLKLTDGEFAQTLKNAAKELNTLLDRQALAPSVRTLVTLYNELSRIWNAGANTEAGTMKHLHSLESWLTKELDLQGDARTDTKETMREVLRELRTALANPKEMGPTLEKSLQLLGQNAQIIQHGIKLQLDPRSTAAMRDLATKLEQMGNIQETLNKLNPVMQALGEPALLLFPFLFQGLISHTEVSVNKEFEKKKTKTEEDGSNKNEEGHTGGAFQRVQISVPLPTMGQVEVDVMHRGKEIYVQLSTEDPEVAEFLLEQLEHLAATLREQGFEKAELVAHNGPVASIVPPWAETLRAKTSILA